MHTAIERAVCRDYRKYRETGGYSLQSLSAALMAHHYPQHAQAQGYPPYPAANYGYATAYYQAYPAHPGAPGYPYDPAAVAGAALTHPQGGPPTAPEIPGVSSQLASHAMQRLISAEMREAGFESAEPGAIRRLELEVAACTFHLQRAPWDRSLTLCPVVQQLYERAHEYANLANRAKPVVTDVLAASDDYNLEPSEVYRLTKKSRKRKRGMPSHSVVPPMC